jgi:hypothetical protein
MPVHLILLVWSPEYLVNTDPKPPSFWYEITGNSPVTSSVLGPDIFLSTLFSNTLSLRSSLALSDHIKTNKIIYLHTEISENSVLFIMRAEEVLVKTSVPFPSLRSTPYFLHSSHRWHHAEICSVSCTHDVLSDFYPKDREHAVAQWLKHCATNRKVAGSIPMKSMEFFIDIILPAVLWPWDRLSL